MVVSEIGARLSPNMAPPMMAPSITAGLQPICTASGNMIGVTVLIVPPWVPQAVEMTTEIKKVAAGRRPALMFREVHSQISPLISPLSRSM